MQRKKNPSAFIRNTYSILECPDFNDIIGWNEEGNGFIIYDLQKFQAEILPLYFKHQKYSSFVRQLNMYGFHKQRHPLTQNYFQHQSFRRGQNLNQIKRKPQKKKKGEEQYQTNNNNRQMGQNQQLLKQNSQQFENQNESNGQLCINPEQPQFNSEQSNRKQNQHNFGQNMKMETNFNNICIQEESLNPNRNLFGQLCEHSILQNQILRKMYPTITLCQKLLKQKLRNQYSFLLYSNPNPNPNPNCNANGKQDKLNEESNPALTLDHLKSMCDLLKKQTMKLSAVLDSSLS